MRTFLIDKSDYESPAELHARLARSLAFPSHYGANLSALDDCLGDISEATRILLVGGGAGENDYDLWFEKLIRVMRRAADENPWLEIEIGHP